MKTKYTLSEQERQFIRAKRDQANQMANQLMMQMNNQIAGLLQFIMVREGLPETSLLNEQFTELYVPEVAATDKKEE